MAKLNTYTAWIQEVITYWDALIDAEAESKQSLGYGDPKKAQIKSELKADLRSYMNDIEAQAIIYESDETKRTEFIGVLLSAGTYIIAKDIAATPAAPVVTIPTLPNNDLRDLFAWWLVDFSPYDGFFTINIAMEQTDPEDPLSPEVLTWSLSKNPPYDTQLSAFDGYAAQDLARFESFLKESANSQMERAAYLMFAGQAAVIVRDETADLNTKILVDYKAQDILDKFNWSIVGLNA